MSCVGALSAGCCVWRCVVASVEVSDAGRCSVIFTSCFAGPIPTGFGIWLVCVNLYVVWHPSSPMSQSPDSEQKLPLLLELSSRQLVCRTPCSCRGALCTATWVCKFRRMRLHLVCPGNDRIAWPAVQAHCQPPKLEGAAVIS